MNSLNEKALPAAQPLDVEHMHTARTVELPERCDAHAELNLGVRFSEPAGALLLDGSNVAFADIHTLQAMVDARLKALDRACDIMVCNPSDELRAILELTGFDSLLPVIGIDSHPQARGNVFSLSGEMGPGRVQEIEAELQDRLAVPRPRLVIDIVAVHSMHLGVANVLVKAQRLARESCGDIDVFVEADSQPQRLLKSVGIVGTMRP